MKRVLQGITIAVLALFVLTGCETDNKTLLTDGTWKFHNATTSSEDANIQQLVALLKAFMTDATLEFQSDGTYILTSPLAEEPETGSWSLVGDDQLIMTPDDEVASTANIETLSKDELKFIETFVDQEMNSYSVTTTWKK